MCDENEQKSQRLKQFEQKLGETRKQHGERLSGWSLPLMGGVCHIDLCLSWGVFVTLIFASHGKCLSH